MSCCDYGCTQGKDCPTRAHAHGCPAGAVDDWTKANIKGDLPIEMIEPNSWIATMEWLQNTIFPCLVSLVIGVVVTTIYFLTR